MQKKWYHGRYSIQKRAIIAVMIVFISISLHGAYSLGIENFTTTFATCRVPNGLKARLGIIANQTSCDRHGKRTVDLLKEQGFNVVLLFATEHGFDGSVHASRTVANTVDEKTGIPIVSLYGEKKGEGRIKQIPQEYVDNVDALVFDIQEAGMRHYTYLDTLLRVMQSAALYDKPIIVCDRPNFLGNRIDGPPGNMRLFKKESVGSLPLRHGMTIGEVARYFNEHVVEKKADLYVVPLERYSRADESKHFFVHHLSPNITSYNAVHGYSFLGILGEVRPCDVGVGTSQAFQLICLPDSTDYDQIAWHSLQEKLRAYNVTAYPHRYFSERKKKWLKGLRLQVENIARLKSFEVLLEVLDFFKQAGVKLALSTYFDTAVGDASVRQWLEGTHSKQEVIERAKTGAKKFLEKATDCFLYHPLPHISRYHICSHQFIAV